MLPLLRTKTTIPPTRPRHVERPRLLERVAEGTRRALTLIVAPAGFGKTTVAAAWAQTRQLPVAWLSLQPADRPRERFLAYLIQALQTISPHLGQTALALMHGGSPDGALFALVNDLAEIDIARVALGQSVTVKLDAFPGEEFPAKVTAIDPVGQEYHGDMTYQVTVMLDEADARFMWNVTATVNIDIK